jgi:Protein of unknown function (DUF3306)
MSRTKDGDGGFLSRWARRKQESTTITGDNFSESSPRGDPAGSELNSDAHHRQVQGEVKGGDADLPMPSLDDITPGGDVTAFFAKHVPEALRTAALRKLWVTDPEIRNFIEMADYQWDFNNPDSIPGWASKLENVDVKAMAERIFGMIQPVPADAQAEDSSECAPNAPHLDGLREDPVSVVESAPSPIHATMVESAPDDHCAVQNIASNSSIYATPRKRHGGALPT